MQAAGNLWGGQTVKFSHHVRIACAIALVAVSAGAALADISAFNAAVKAGDFKTASVEAKGVWATWNPSDPDTATVAREFGFASYVAGDFAAARDYGQFLRDKGGTLAKPDDQPATSRVLHTAANFRLAATDATRKDLSDALQAREAAPGVDSISLLAAEALYKADWAAGRWDEVNASGMSAYRIISRGGDAVSVRALEAQTTAAAGAFLSRRDKDDYDTMVDAHDAIIEAVDTATDPKRRAALVTLSFTARAWAHSILSALNTSSQTGSLIPIKAKYREMRYPERGYFDSDGSSSPGNACDIEVNTNAFTYPRSALYKGMVGTVLMRFDLDEEGRVVDAETLAAVPARQFSAAVMDAVPKIRFTRISGSSSNCTIARKNYIFTLMFGIL